MWLYHHMAQCIVTFFSEGTRARFFVGAIVAGVCHEPVEITEIYTCA